VSGVTGQAIIRAILQGQRDPRQLAKLRDRRVAASEEEIAHSLEGNWREDILFELQQVVDSYDFHQKQIAACDVQLPRYLSVLPARSLAYVGEGSSPDTRTGKPKKQRKHKLQKEPTGFRFSGRTTTDDGSKHDHHRWSRRHDDASHSLRVGSGLHLIISQ